MPEVRDYTALVSGYSLNGVAGQGAFYTYSFPTVVAYYYNGLYPEEGLASFRELTEAEKAAARSALEAYASISGLVFFEVLPGEGDILFSAFEFDLMNSSTLAGFAYYPSASYDSLVTSDVFLDYSWAGNTQVLLHEIGHALGFKHTFEGDPVLADDLDNWGSSVMSYTPGGYAGDVLGPLDVEAIQYLYGDADADGDHLTSWSWDAATYTLTQTGGALSETIQGVGSADIILGMGGDDTLNGRSGADRLEGGEGNDTLDGGEGDDELIGGEGNNTAYGRAGDDRMVGGGGTDNFFGGSGASEFDSGGGNDNLYTDYDGSPFSFVVDSGAGTDWFHVNILASAGAATLSLTDLIAAGSSIVGVEGVAVWGNAFGNSIAGTSGFDQITGGIGADSLFGLGGNDMLLGMDGADILVGGAGGDTINGGAGADRIVYGAVTESVAATPDVVLAFETGLDKIELTLVAPTLVSWVVTDQAGVRYDYVTVETSTTTMNFWVQYGVVMSDFILSSAINGTSGDDTLTGGPDDDVLNGLGGNDTLDGGAGADAMNGAAGDDIYFVDAAGDVVTEALNEGTDEIRTALASYSLAGIANVEKLTFTGTGSFTGTGNGLANTITGGASADLLDGGAEADTLVGGLGGDTYIVDNSSDIVTELAGGGSDDRVRTALAFYTLAAEVEILEGVSTAGQQLTGNALANQIVGEAGADLLDGGTGADAMQGKGGNDVYVVDVAGDIVTELSGQGTDEIRTALATYSIAALANVEYLTGLGSVNQTLTGNGGNNLINGGLGADAMAGGGGNDSYIVDNASDAVTEAASAGTDIVQSSVAFTLGANVENLTLTGLASVNATGNGGANIINGNAGANRIDGGAGADRMNGGDGNDVYIVDNAGDLVFETNAAGGTDTVNSAVTFSLVGQNLEKLFLTGTAAIDGTGNSFANTLVGNSGANTLNGGVGIDLMNGGAGDDVFIVDSSSDTVQEAVGGGTDTVRTYATFSLSDTYEVENITIIGVDSVNASGNKYANILIGNAFANVLNGRGGADVMSGGDGNDTYWVDNVGDQVIEASATGGTDTVNSAIAFSLAGQQLENLVLTGSAVIDGTGNALANRITGNTAANRLDGGTGADWLSGGAGDDVYIVDNVGDKVVEAYTTGGNDRVESAVSFNLSGLYVETLVLTGAAAIDGTGNSLAQAITGNAAANRLIGNAGNDALDGAGADDKIFGGAGNDTLSGGAGLDGFYFDAALSTSGNVDQILDYSVADDTIFLSRSVFTGIAANGALNPAAFQLGTAANDAGDRILYDQASGDIFYDRDGSGTAAAILFAHVSAGTALTDLDFVAYTPPA